MINKFATYSLFLLCLSTKAALNAATLPVLPGESIQAQIDASSAGDIVAIFGGTYSEDITINKAIRLVEVNGEEVSLLGDDSQANVDFLVEDDAAAIASALSSSGTSLDGAEGLVVSSGDTTVQGASDIQSLSGIYDASSSSYTVSDTAGAILSDMGAGAVIDEGVAEINVNGPVGAGVGVQLNSNSSTNWTIYINLCYALINYCARTHVR